MAARKQVSLSDEQRRELERARDRAEKPYVRERAAAILKVNAGQSVRQVAMHGLLRQHEPETVSGWIERYVQEGLPGLQVRAGAGRKPGFSPTAD